MWRHLRLGIALAALVFLVSGMTTGAKSPTDPDPGLIRPVAFLTIVGDTQGEIEGSSTVEGREGSIEVLGFQHEITSPRDAASGLPTGKRQHQPVTVLKNVDKSTPLLWLALVNNENLTDVEFRFYRPSRSGEPENYYTVTLLNASIAEISAVADVDTGGRLAETIAFTYQKIIWTWEDGGFIAEDDWEAPIA